MDDVHRIKGLGPLGARIKPVMFSTRQPVGTTERHGCQKRPVAVLQAPPPRASGLCCRDTGSAFVPAAAVTSPRCHPQPKDPVPAACLRLGSQGVSYRCYQEDHS